VDDGGAAIQRVAAADELELPGEGGGGIAG